MKPKEHRETHKTMEETPANNRDTTTKEERIYGLKASPRKRTQFYEERANKMQHAKRSIKPNCQSTSNSIKKMDSSKRTFEERSLSEKNYRFFLN